MTVTMKEVEHHLAELKATVEQLRLPFATPMAWTLRIDGQPLAQKMTYYEAMFWRQALTIQFPEAEIAVVAVAEA